MKKYFFSLALAIIVLLVPQSHAVTNQCVGNNEIPQDIKEAAQKDPNYEACFCRAVTDAKGKSTIQWFFVDFLVNYAADTDKPIYVNAKEEDQIACAAGTKTKGCLFSVEPRESPAKYCVQLQQSLGGTRVIQGENGVDLITNTTSTLYRYGAGLIGIVCVLVIVISGIQIMLGGAEESMVSSAKNRIMQALLSLLLLFSSGMILRTVNPNFFQSAQQMGKVTMSQKVVDTMIARGYDIVQDTSAFDETTIKLPSDQQNQYLRIPESIAGAAVTSVSAQFGGSDYDAQDIVFTIQTTDGDKYTIVIKVDKSLAGTYLEYAKPKTD